MSFVCGYITSKQLRIAKSRGMYRGECYSPVLGIWTTITFIRPDKSIIMDRLVGAITLERRLHNVKPQPNIKGK